MPESNSPFIYAGIEGGGTKFNCIIATNTKQPSMAAEIIAVTRIPTTTPDETLTKVIDFFKPYRTELRAIGLACFAPLSLHSASKTYGYLTTTPKPEWANTDLLNLLQDTFPIPIPGGSGSRAGVLDAVGLAIRAAA
ncbi:MAG TPA: ROK family protein [Anaerolineales bacterium]|nr:ROK family protein [Anaerolineales bacterium]